MPHEPQHLDVFSSTLGLTEIPASGPLAKHSCIEASAYSLQASRLLVLVVMCQGTIKDEIRACLLLEYSEKMGGDPNNIQLVQPQCCALAKASELISNTQSQADQFEASFYGTFIEELAESGFASGCRPWYLKNFCLLCPLEYKSCSL